VQEATFPLSARKPRQAANLPTQRPVVGSQPLQLRSCFLTVRDPQHTHTQARTRVCPASDAHLHGHRALSPLVLKTRQQKTPLRHSTPLSTFSLGITRHTKTAKPCL
jgi:hypothetical protein